MRRDLWNSAATCAKHLRGDDAATRRAIGLGTVLRQLGLVRTLEWLRQKEGGEKVATGLRQALDLPPSKLDDALANLSRRALLAHHRRAMAFAKALHLLASASKREAEEHHP